MPRLRKPLQKEEPETSVLEILDNLKKRERDKVRVQVPDHTVRTWILVDRDISDQDLMKKLNRIKYYSNK